jgi:hypothetical protein
VTTPNRLTIADDATGIRIARRTDAPASTRWAPWTLELIAVRDALIGIQVAHVGHHVVPRDRETLGAMVRAIGHVMAGHGLLRPLVVYVYAEKATGEASVVEIEATALAATPSKIATLKLWEDDQDWHRGRFIFFTILPQGLLSPEIKGFERATTELEGLKVEDDLARLDAVARDLRGTGTALLTLARDWAVAWDKSNKGAAPDEPAVRELGSRLAAWAAQPLPTPSLPVLVLASYSSSEPAPVVPGVAESPEDTLYFDQSAGEEVRGGWEAEASARLLAVRRQLQDRRRSTLVVHAKCAAALAMRAGAVFHASTDFVLAVVQRDPGTQQDVLWRPTAGRNPRPVELDITPRAPAGSPTELQLRIGVTRPVDRDADAWTAASPTVHPFILDISVPPGGDNAIHGPDHAWDIARAIRAALLNAQQSLLTPLPVRIFYSGPTALAVWIGAQLNAVGTVILMDWLKADERPRYVASFTFQPGA